ncbi:VanW family protein [Microbispora sp. RL4-1S]|uniref:VanW family protein n=1 Tax=Microbispora oryzae TaxID=2806554 RepID=A0A940WFW2_9ACTN|nr:VanW family protein [Microbispora oryzae]MBP2703322.1 VanW family protein [Microbispora oryzae]
MRNAGASTDPPPEPSAAASEAVPSPPASSTHRHPVRRGSGSLPRGVSADIFAERPPHPAPAPKPRKSVLPPARPVEPWPVAETVIREEPQVALLTPEHEPRGHLLRYGLIGLFSLLLLTYLVPAVSMAGRILPGTMILGVDVGGQNEAEAAQTLRERLYALTRTPVILRQGTRRLTVDPQAAGLSLDVEATVRRAVTAFPNPVAVWGALTGTREAAPVVSVDEAKLAAAVRAYVAGPVEEPDQEGGVTFKGLVPVPVYPRAGRRIDRAAVAARIRDAYLSPDRVVPVTVIREQPTVPRMEVRRAVEWARKAVSAPITLTTGSASATMSPTVIARHLTFDPRGVDLRPRFDAADAVADLESQLVGPDRAARNASFTVSGGRPVLVHGRPGLMIDTDRLAADVVRALDDGRGLVPVAVVDGPPRISDADALRMGVTERVGAFSTSYACCPPVARNIETAARLLDGRLVPPGRTFSLNADLGRRDPSRGFTGMAATTIRGVAGSDVPGMSQFATTLLNALLRAGFEGVDFTRPDSPVAGSMDAAVSYPEPDLVWKNDSSHGVLIQAVAANGTLTVTLWSTRRQETAPRTSVAHPAKRSTAVPDGGAAGARPTARAEGRSAVQPRGSSAQARGRSTGHARARSADHARGRSVEARRGHGNPQKQRPTAVP